LTHSKTQVFSVTEPSEDSDGEMGILFETAVQQYADWYSRNLAAETAKGKRERARQGYHNNHPPFGMDKTDEGILYPNEAELEGLLKAFELYATGAYSDNQIARFLNDSGYTNKTGSRFSTDTVRDLLQNRTYLGYTKYQPYQRNADGSRSYKADIHWFEGKHETIIPKDLFNYCQEVRANKASHHTYYPKHRMYLLNLKTLLSVLGI
jgi:site-specific DNA recombinase